MNWFDEAVREHETAHAVQALRDTSQVVRSARRQRQATEALAVKIDEVVLPFYALFYHRAKARGWYCRTRTVRTEAGLAAKALLYFYPEVHYRPGEDYSDLFVYEIKLDPAENGAVATAYYDLRDPIGGCVSSTLPIASIDATTIKAALQTFLRTSLARYEQRLAGA